jgi:hypothetical protein
MPTIWVEMPLKSNWPTRAELASREAAIRHLNAIAIGKCTGAGAGRGMMDFSYQVSDEASAKKAIDSAMQELMPAVSFKIRVTP